MPQATQKLFLETLEEWYQVCEDAFRFLESDDLSAMSVAVCRAHELGFLTTWLPDIAAFSC